MAHRIPFCARLIAALILIVLLLTPLAGALAAPPQQSAVTATTLDALRLRAGPGTSYATLAIIPRGETLSVQGRNAAGSWIAVTYSGMTGWVAAWYTRLDGDLNSVPVAGEAAAPASPVALTATTSTVLFLRDGPGTSYRALGRVPAQIMLAVLGRDAFGTWLYVEHSGQRGWIAAWLCTISGEVSSAPVLSADGVPLGAPPAMPAVAGVVAQPPIVPRTAWGARAVSEGYTPHTPQRITIHMDGAYFERDPIQRMQLLQSWSIDTRGWVDIPYHYVIDREGVIYEGRPVQFVGDTGTNYDPAGHISVALMGDFDIQAPAQAQIDALVALAAWLSATYRIPPALIQGHRDYAYTSCPGEYFYFDYVQNGAIRAAVEARLAGR